MSESILKILESSRFGLDRSSSPGGSRRSSPRKSPGTPRLRKVVELAMEENSSGGRERGHSVSSRVSIMDKTSKSTLRSGKSVDRPEFNEVKIWVKQLQKDAHSLQEHELKASTDVDFLNAQIRAMRKAFGQLKREACREREYTTRERDVKDTCTSVHSPSAHCACQPVSCGPSSARPCILYSLAPTLLPSMLMLRPTTTCSALLSQLLQVH